MNEETYRIHQTSQHNKDVCVPQLNLQTQHNSLTEFCRYREANRKIDMKDKRS